VDDKQCGNGKLCEECGTWARDFFQWDQTHHPNCPAVPDEPVVVDSNIGCDHR
jgi:hypothetical protein